jgi:CBS domain-containing protein
MKAWEIMTADPVAVMPGDSVRHAAGIMRRLNVGAVPVVDGAATRVLRGIITDRDITIRCTAEGHAPSCPVRDHMTTLPLQTVKPEDDVHTVLDRMERAQVRRIPVVKDGILVGVIAQADIATKVGPKEPREVEVLLERMSAAAVPMSVGHA